jgi:tetratricopeptide (TPR) repeat protein
VKRRLVSIIVTGALAAAAATPAAAQGARATGSVRDTGGKAIKGATIRAVNPDAIPSEVTAVSNNDGRWAMIGLKTGAGWTFIAEAPGFYTVKAEAVARVGNSAPMNFVLARDPGPIPGALTPNIEGQIEAAIALRNQGRYEQAITAFQEIRARNPKLTSVNFVMADMYVGRAAAESDTAARRALIDLAVSSYDEVLKADATNERAKAARAAVLASR